MKRQIDDADTGNRYVLIGGIEANLNEMYASTMDTTFTIFLKKGNFRYVKGNIIINVQKQLTDLRVTYKPFGTHITAARICPDTSTETAIMWCQKIAENLGDRTWSITLSPYGVHSVRITGELEEAIQDELSKLSILRNLSSPRPIHVELRPRLRKYEKYVEVRHAWFDNNLKTVQFA